MFTNCSNCRICYTMLYCHPLSITTVPLWSSFIYWHSSKHPLPSTTIHHKSRTIDLFLGISWVPKIYQNQNLLAVLDIHHLPFFGDGSLLMSLKSLLLIQLQRPARRVAFGETVQCGEIGKASSSESSCLKEIKHVMGLYIPTTPNVAAHTHRFVGHLSSYRLSDYPFWKSTLLTFDLLCHSEILDRPRIYR